MTEKAHVKKSTTFSLTALLLAKSVGLDAADPSQNKRNIILIFINDLDHAGVR